MFDISTNQSLLNDLNFPELSIMLVIRRLIFLKKDFISFEKISQEL